MELIVLVLLFGTPIFFTICNIVFLCKLKSSTEEGKFRAFVDIAGMLAGTIYTLIFFGFFFDFGIESFFLLDSRFAFTSRSSEYAPTIIVLMVISLVGFYILRFFRHKLPPIPKCLCLAVLFIGIVLCVVYIIQIFGDLASELLIFGYALLFPLNIIFCFIRLVWACAWEETSNAETLETDGKLTRLCKKSLKEGQTWLVIFAFAVLIYIVITIVLILFGQSPDAAIRAFTQTSDWTLSAYNLPPPERIPSGHYLYTTALRGSKEFVKPLRLGIRGGEKIVVNRQLCVANAFEQYIMEKTPHFHKVVRALYDKYGYPLSIHITTKKRANMVYALMKPLEWFFVLFLYCFDKHPENRIAMQYL
jgi:hypothetical protein